MTLCIGKESVKNAENFGHFMNTLLVYSSHLALCRFITWVVGTEIKCAEQVQMSGQIIESITDSQSIVTPKQIHPTALLATKMIEMIEENLTVVQIVNIFYF